VSWDAGRDRLRLQPAGSTGKLLNLATSHYHALVPCILTFLKFTYRNGWLCIVKLSMFETEIGRLIGAVCLQPANGKAHDGKRMQLAITGFLERHSAKFMKELWTLLLSAQSNPSGIPQVSVTPRIASR
jgi:hypothetical protein